PRERRSRRRAARGPLGTEPRPAREWTLPGRGPGASHRPGRAGGRSGGAPLSGGAGSPPRPFCGGAPNDRVVAAHGRGARRDAARVALATARRAAGRADDAAMEQRRAVELWEAKGATLLAPDGAEAAPPDVTSHARRRVRPNAATASAAAHRLEPLATLGDAL